MRPCHASILRPAVNIERRSKEKVTPSIFYNLVRIVIEVGRTQLIGGADLMIKLGGVSGLIQLVRLRYREGSVDIDRIGDRYSASGREAGIEFAGPASVKALSNGS